MSSASSRVPGDSIVHSLKASPGSRMGTRSLLSDSSFFVSANRGSVVRFVPQCHGLGGRATGDQTSRNTRRKKSTENPPSAVPASTCSKVCFSSQMRDQPTIGSSTRNGNGCAPNI